MEAPLRIAVLNTFQTLLDCLSDLKAAMMEEQHLIAWVQGVPTDSAVSAREAREAAFNAIAQLEYTAEQAPRSILLCPGYIGASEQTLATVNRVNAAKQAFKAAMIALRANKSALLDPELSQSLESILGKREAKFACALRKMGLARLHLKQCYRLVPALERTPIKLSWTWANTRAIKRITVQQAIDRLSKRRSNPSIDFQLQKLSALSPHEPLAIVQELAPHLRINVAFEAPEGGQERIMVKGPIPIFFKADAGTLAPRISPPSEKRGKNAGRPIRSDVKIDPEPFIPAIRAHRYREKC
jgi:hypothetical protein